MLKHSTTNSLEKLMTLSKIDLKSMSSELSLPYGYVISKDDMNKCVSNAMLDVHGDITGEVLFLIEEEESNEGTINL